MKKLFAFVGLLSLAAINAQNTGIGTTNPQTKLHIDGASDNVGVPTGAQQANDVVVTSTGNVGIGINSPEAKFHISNGFSLIKNQNLYSLYMAETIGGVSHPMFAGLKGRGDFSNITYPLSGDFLSAFVGRDAIDAFAVGGTDGGATIYFRASENFTRTNKGTRIEFNTTPIGSNFAANRMSILDNGNIGINTTTPTEKLEVNGNIKTSSLAGTGNRTVVADANGVLRVGSDANNNTGWSLTGNTGTTPTSNYLGTTDNQPLHFKTNATADNNPKMTILPNGKIGINNSTPDFMLDVVSTNGDYNVGSDLGITSFSGNNTSSPGTAFNLRGSRGTVSAPLNLQTGDLLADINYYGTVNGIFQGLGSISSRYTGNGTTVGSNLLFRTVGTPVNGSIIFMDDAGKVGIGTITPQASLHIDGAQDGSTNAVQEANDVVVTADGRVGVGTYSPAHKLNVLNGWIYSKSYNSSSAHVGESIGVLKASPYFMGLKGAGTFTTPTYPPVNDVLVSLVGRDAIDGYSPSTYGGAQIDFMTAQNFTSSNKGTSIYFSTTPLNSTILTFAMIINPSGNVGIGTSAPSQKLDVIGNVRASGSFISGSTTLSVPDYVFQKYYTGFSSLNKDYRFLTLNETETFIKEKGHLPGYPSAKEIKESGNLDITQHTLTNQEKIEELYLHTIEQDKKIEQQQQIINELMKRLEALEKK